MNSFDIFLIYYHTLHRRLHTSPTLLPGSLESGRDFLVGGSYEPLAKKKYENLKEYLSLYPEFQYIFIGDNGQGDVRAVEMLMQDNTYNKPLERVYVHQVQPLRNTHVISTDTITYGRCPKICFFRNYIDAGIDALKHNLIRGSGLRRLVCEALKDFDSIPLDDWKSLSVRGGLRGMDEKRTELRHAVMRANVILSSLGLEPVYLPPIPCQYPRGSAVRTPYGKGVVLRYRPRDGIYEVLLQWDLSGESPPAIGYFTSLSLSTAFQKPQPSAAGLAITSVAQTTNSQTPSNKQIKVPSHAQPPMQESNKGNTGATLNGALLWTPYGRGRMVRQRGKIIEVRYSWGATGYLRANDVVVLANAPPPPVSSSAANKDQEKKQKPIPNASAISSPLVPSSAFKSIISSPSASDRTRRVPWTPISGGKGPLSSPGIPLWPWSWSSSHENSSERTIVTSLEGSVLSSEIRSDTASESKSHRCQTIEQEFHFNNIWSPGKQIVIPPFGPCVIQKLYKLRIRSIPTSSTSGEDDEVMDVLELTCGNNPMTIHVPIFSLEVHSCLSVK